MEPEGHCGERIRKRSPSSERLLFTFHCFSPRGENTQEKFFVRETAFKRGQFCRFSCPTILKSKCLNMSKLINQPPPPTHCTIQNNLRENNYKPCKNLFILREQLQEQALPKSWHLQNWPNPTVDKLMLISPYFGLFRSG